LVDIVPAENSTQYETVGQQRTEHHKDTVFSPMGWTTFPFIVPSPELSLSDRKIPLAELGALFEGVLMPADVVETCVDFCGPEYVADGCFAWGEPNKFRAGFYGEVAEGIIKNLHMSEFFFDNELARVVATMLARFGAKYQLLLVSHGSWIVNLVDQDHIAMFLSKGVRGLTNG
jgi:hypothetical protein